MNTNTDRDPPAWIVIVGLAVFGGVYLLWAYAFDAVARWLRGAWIEDILNVITSPWPWIGLVVIYAVVSALLNRSGKTS